MNNQLKLGSILSYLQMAIGVIIQLVYTPVMIRLLGKSEYGLYNTVASTISMLSVLSLGFNSGYIRYYAIYKKNNGRGPLKIASKQNAEKFFESKEIDRRHSRKAMLREVDATIGKFIKLCKK